MLESPDPTPLPEAISSQLPFCPVVFLGIAEQVIQEGAYTDIHRLANTTLFPFYPQRLDGLFMVLGLTMDIEMLSDKVVITVQSDTHPQDTAFTEVAVGLTLENASGEITEKPALGSALVGGSFSRCRTIRKNPIAQYMIVIFPVPPLLMRAPSTVTVTAVVGSWSGKIGAFECVFAPTAPISPEEKKLLLERPSALSAFMFRIGCALCKDSFGLYEFLDSDVPADAIETPGSLAKEAPELWNCRCKTTSIPLQYVKQGLHEVFRHQALAAGRLAGFTPIYQKVAVDAVLTEYQKLINSEPLEPKVQKFLEDNEIMWAFLEPVKILHQPHVLTKCKGDFAVLGPERTLYLIEIEKPQSKLARNSDGGLHGDLQRGLDQLRNWRVVVEKDFRTLVDQLGFKDGDIHKVEYVLIAGLAHSTKSEDLETLRKSFDNIRFYTFDELTTRLQTIKTYMTKL